MPDWDRGYIQIYTGDGKGKTTAAIGLALRAAGAGLRTYIGQFMKGIQYSELRALGELAEWITVEQYGGAKCIALKDEPSAEDIALARDGLDRARAAMLSERYRVVVLDEVNVAIGFKLLEVSDALRFIEEKPKNVELILTGRRAPRELVENADLVTEMRPVKHYFDQGVPGRVGIER